MYTKILVKTPEKKVHTPHKSIQLKKIGHLYVDKVVDINFSNKKEVN